MRILFLSNLYPPQVQGGYELLCRDVCEALRDRGHHCQVLSTPELRLTAPFPGPPPGWRGAEARIFLHNYRRTRAEILRFQPEVLFFWSQLRLGSGPLRAAQDSGVPLLCTWNDEHILGLKPRSWRWNPRSLLAAVLDRTLFWPLTWQGLPFRRNVVISQLLASRLRQQGFPGELQVVYQGVPLSLFPSKSSVGRPGRPLRLLYVGQLHAYKGVHTLLEALKQLPFEAHLTVVGSGRPDYEAQLRSLATGLEDRIEWVGRLERSALPPYYHRSDAFLFPSIWEEPYGLTHLEAMACGIPVLATLHGGHGEHLRDGINCLGFQPDDAASLVRALTRLVEQPELAAALVKAGRELVTQELNFDHYVASLEAVLEGSLTP